MKYLTCTSPKKLFLRCFILFALLVFWFVMSILFNAYSPPSVLTYAYDPATDNIQMHTKELFKEQTVNGTFTARDNHLGIVSVRFTTFGRINNDVLIFRLKEIGQQNYFYQNTYKVNQFQPEGLFTFGFPIIPDSKGKVYQFQLLSIQGVPGDAIAISLIQPVFVTKYQFTKNELLANKMLLVNHVYKLFINSLTGGEFILSSFIYFIPFLLYTLWVFPIQPILKALAKRYRVFVYINAYIVSVIVMIVVVINILFINQLSSGIAIVILLVAWLLFIQQNKLDSRVTFVFVLFLLFLCTVLQTLNQTIIAEKAAEWIYYFMLLGGLQMIFKLSLPTRKALYKIIVSIIQRT